MLRKAATYTLGCKVNQAETEAIEAALQEHGYEIVGFDERADVYLINTYTVTSSADRKSRQIIRRARKTGRDQGSILIVMGCYAQSSSEEILDSLDVDLVIGNTHRSRVAEYLDRFREDKIRRVYVDDIMQEKKFEELGSGRLIRRTRAFLKIQEGCQQFCSYCIIPYTRGPLRSKDPDNVIREIIELEKEGFHEVVLTGIHIGSYGKDFPEDYTLTELLKRIIASTESIHIRISSIEPTEVTEEMAALIAAEDRVCKHLHIPLQSGDDYILKKMNRPYDTADFREKIKMIRSFVPDISITTDIMVGFPYEESENAKNTLAFAEEMEFSDIHVFKYSPRHNTPASKFPNQVLLKDKEKRSRELIALAHQMKLKYYERFLGKDIWVLLEQKHGEFWEGHASNYLRVLVKGEAAKNQLRKVNLSEIADDGIIGNFL